MVYLIIGLALLCFSVKGFCGKKISCQAKNTRDASLFNFLRMLFCIIIGFASVMLENAGCFLQIERKMLFICLFSGASNAVFLICWILAVQKNSMVLVDVALTLGSLIPSLVCTVFFAEPLSAAKLLGFALIITATVILAKRQSSEKKRHSLSGIVLIVLATLGDGCVGAAQQLYKHFYTADGMYTEFTVYPKSIFHFYTYIFAALLLLGVSIFYGIKKHEPLESKTSYVHTYLGRKTQLSFSLICYIFAIAICMFAANYLQTVATNDYGMSSQLLYPLIKGGCLITVNFVALIFFNEKITVRTCIASLIALSGMIIMSIL